MSRKSNKSLVNGVVATAIKEASTTSGETQITINVYAGRPSRRKRQKYSTYIQPPGRQDSMLGT